MKFLRNPMAHYGGFITVYLLLTLVLPANRIAMHAYRISSFRYHVLLLLVVLPFIGIWFAAFYGFSRLRRYAAAIHNTAEGHDFHQLAVGSGWLAYALPIVALLSIVLNSIANMYPTFHPVAIITNNYIGLILPLVAFTFLSTGARALSSRANLRLSLGSGRALILIFALLGVFYCYFTFRNLGVSSVSSTDNAYFLPVWLVVVTMVMPYLYAWFIGLLAAYEITLFAKQVSGVLYREALRYVSLGIAIVIVSSITAQYLTSITPRTGSLRLNFILLFIFLIEILMAGGYTCIALGARRLQRIEEV